jgi:hypothetical protein
MFLRLLPLLCLLSLSQAVLGQQARKPESEPETCRVTKPYQTSLFIPPFPHPAQAPVGWFWLTPVTMNGWFR